MKTVVRLTRLKDGSRILSFAMHVSEKEFQKGQEASDAPHLSNLRTVMDYAREGNLDGFLCFLRILWSEVYRA